MLLIIIYNQIYLILPITYVDNLFIKHIDSVLKCFYFSKKCQKLSKLISNLDLSFVGEISNFEVYLL